MSGASSERKHWSVERSVMALCGESEHREQQDRLL